MVAEEVTGDSNSPQVSKINSSSARSLKSHKTELTLRLLAQSLVHIYQQIYLPKEGFPRTKTLLL